MSVSLCHRFESTAMNASAFVSQKICLGNAAGKNYPLI